MHTRTQAHAPSCLTARSRGSALLQAVSVAVTSAFGFYISSAVACYSALGDGAPGEVLQGFEQAPDWWVAEPWPCGIPIVIANGNLASPSRIPPGIPGFWRAWRGAAAACAVLAPL